MSLWIVCSEALQKYFAKKFYMLGALTSITECAFDQARQLRLIFAAKRALITVHQDSTVPTLTPIGMSWVDLSLRKKWLFPHVDSVGHKLVVINY